jgi:hypothetical protein
MNGRVKDADEIAARDQKVREIRSLFMPEVAEPLIGLMDAIVEYAPTAATASALSHLRQVLATHDTLLVSN